MHKNESSSAGYSLMDCMRNIAVEQSFEFEKIVHVSIADEEGLLQEFL